MKGLGTFVLGFWLGVCVMLTLWWLYTPETVAVVAASYGGGFPKPEPHLWPLPFPWPW